MSTTNNAMGTQENKSLPADNAPKRAAECADNPSLSKRLKLFDTEQNPCPLICDSDVVWDQTPGNFLSHFLLPLMDTQNEKVLVNWLRKMNVLKDPPQCKCKCKEFTLQYDQLFWLCENCNRSFSIWSFSFFKFHKCHGLKRINDALFCILAWCKKMTVDEASKSLEISKEIISNIYNKCSSTAEDYIAQEYRKFASFGGVGSVVLLDLQLDGWTRKNMKRDREHKNRFSALWVADTKYVPTQYWISILPFPKACLQLTDIQPRTKFVSENCTEIHDYSCQRLTEKNKDDLIVNDGDKDESSKTIQAKSLIAPCELRVLKEQQKIAVLTQKAEEVKAVKTDRRIKKPKGKDKKCKHIENVEVLVNKEDKTPPDDEESDANFESELDTTPVSSVEQENRRKTRRYRKELPQSEEMVEHEKFLQGNELSEHTKQEEKAILDFEGEINNQEDLQCYIKSEPYFDSEKESFNDSNVKYAIMEIVDELISPGSIVLANEENIPNICSMLRASKKYEAVMSFSEILSLDAEHESTSSILGNIWEAANGVSQRLTSHTQKAASRIVSMFLWRQYFGSSLSEAAYHILHQIPTHYNHRKPVLSAFHSEEFYF